MSEQPNVSTSNDVSPDPLKQGSNDPFSPEEAPGVSLIVLMRIYDVLCGIYTNIDHDKATALMEIHSKGGLVGPLPALKLDELLPTGLTKNDK